eukprot:GHVT01045148.1.p1 GENE.GHVT01045148.1~~GHVT01045148.1.p1  ORF type:complete len:386 (+),score=11.39 GHVT01045148.1:186-1343(+)
MSQRFVSTRSIQTGQNSFKYVHGRLTLGRMALSRKLPFFFQPLELRPHLAHRPWLGLSVFSSGAAIYQKVHETGEREWRLRRIDHTSDLTSPFIVRSRYFSRSGKRDQFCYTGQPQLFSRHSDEKGHTKKPRLPTGCTSRRTKLEYASGQHCCVNVRPSLVNGWSAAASPEATVSIWPQEVIADFQNQFSFLLGCRGAQALCGRWRDGNWLTVHSRGTSSYYSKPSNPYRESKSDASSPPNSNSSATPPASVSSNAGQVKKGTEAHKVLSPSSSSAVWRRAASQAPLIAAAAKHRGRSYLRKIRAMLTTNGRISPGDRRHFATRLTELMRSSAVQSLGRRLFRVTSSSGRGGGRREQLRKLRLQVVERSKKVCEKFILSSTDEDR